MKIVSYNINGIRSGINKGLCDWIKINNPDILCIQEIKAYPEQVETKLFNLLGYKQYWFSAKKKGYSGVAILSKIIPNNIEYGIGISKIDEEGRVLRIDFDNISIINIYLPSGNMISRLNFKFFFMNSFFSYIQNLKKQIKNLIICGDYNICHKNIDIHDPVNNQHISGFLPEERIWMTKFINLGFIDSFRKCNKNPNCYSWWSYRYKSKERNKGWRIDYAMVSKHLNSKIKKSYLLPNIIYSDHCPIVLEID